MKESNFDCKKNEHLAASTYFSYEDVDVKLSELVLIDKKIADSGIELSKENVSAIPLSTTTIPDDRIPAYWGSFNEYVPVILG